MSLLGSCFRRATVLALGLSVQPLIVHAQSTGTISGRVLDTQGGGLQGATISLAGTTRGAIVRSDGSYRLTAPAGRYEIRARLLGYTPRADSVTVTAGSDVTKSFTLARAATSIEAVTVTGTRGEERTVISAPVPIDVLSSLEDQLDGPDRDVADDPGARAVVQLPAHHRSATAPTMYGRPRCAASRPTRRWCS